MQEGYLILSFHQSRGIVSGYGNESQQLEEPHQSVSGGACTSTGPDLKSGP